MSDAGAAAEVQRGSELAKATDKHDADKLTPLLILLAFVFLVWIAYWIWVSRVYTTEQSRGLFGDMFGGINALFSAGAFAGLIYTVLLQRKELRLQREELIATRQELKGQREQLQAQNTFLREQALEHTYFEMMRRHEDIVNAIEVETPSGVFRSRRAFLLFYDEFKQEYRSVMEEDLLLTPHEHVQQAYKRFFGNRQSEIGHYFRNLYHMVKFVAESGIPLQHRYSGLARAQLSSYEHLLLFYNGVSEYGEQKFKPLIEQFALLENMPWEDLIFPKFHLDLYECEAYGDMEVDYPAEREHDDN
jgi:hypothetical protein